MNEMATIVHISDLHFGTEDPAMVSSLQRQILEIKPTLIITSGDLTQRAKAEQFLQARQFLDSLPFSQMVVPGNHDVAPWYRPIARLTNGLADYRKYINNNLAPYFQDAGQVISVAGVNSARALVSKGGRINLEQVQHTCAVLSQAGAKSMKMVVTHHPFDIPTGHDPSDLIGRAHLAMEHFARCRVDLFLSGHLHITSTVETAHRYRIQGHSALVVQAGTAVSRRVRGEINSWNLLRIEGEVVTIDRLQWDEGVQTFTKAQTKVYQRVADGWDKLKEE